jgi:protein-tyrosine phosphatase
LPADLSFPRRLTESDLHSAQRIIALDEDEHRSYVEHWFPAWRDRIVYWRVHDIHRTPAAEAFALIEHNVDALVRELTAITPAQPHHPR